MFGDSCGSPQGAIAPGGTAGSGVNWLSIAGDATTGYAAGLGYKASALGAALREGSSYAGGALSAAGEAAQMWEPLADVAPVVGGVIAFGAGVASGQSIGRATANAIGAVAGGYVGAAIGGAACGALASATAGAGALSCGFLTGAGAAIGGFVGGYVGNGVADLAAGIKNWL